MSRLVVSFSGGRTSGYMTKRVLDTWRDRYDDIVVIFANTGQEHEKTLEFVHNCDVYFGFNTVWVEGVPQETIGVGSKAKVVTYETASRQGEPFEAAIKRYGLPSASAPICSDRLKVVPVRNYIREILGWNSKTYDQILGIRADEIDRMSMHAEANRVKYPLIGWGVTKTMVLDWWKEQPFDLGLEELYGNCVWCWKKSDRKLYTIAKNTPEYFDFPARMEELYHTWQSPTHGGVVTGQSFFRKHRKAVDIIATSKTPFIEWTPGNSITQMGLFSMDEMDYSNGCSDSCEVEFV
jgi:hypothetical protein